MVFPPGLDSGIRGPDGRSLTDVYNRVTDVRDSVEAAIVELVTVNTNLARVATAVERLSGVGTALPASWVGLPGYLNGIVGPSAAQNGPNSLFSNVSALRAELSRVGSILVGGDSPSGQNRMLQLVELLTAVEAEAATSADAAAALALVVGSITDDPTGSTLKDLLRSLDVTAAAIQECVCDGGTTPLPPPDNREPLSDCGAAIYPKSRVTAFTPADGPPEFGGSDSSYALEFGTLDVDTSDEVLWDFDTGPTAITWPAIYSPVALDYCLSWNLENNPTPAQVRIARMGTGSFYDNTGSGEIVTGVTGDGSHLFTVAADVRFAIIIDTAPGDPLPGLNFWLQPGVTT